ncbi:MAG: hypothetical protein JRI25_01040 [Deltaproteobacteria bacterium]|nr:hypothetical protein [Deltaproteobacteria bacterium]
MKKLTIVSALLTLVLVVVWVTGYETASYREAVPVPAVPAVDSIAPQRTSGGYSVPKDVPHVPSRSAAPELTATDIEVWFAAIEGLQIVQCNVGVWFHDTRHVVLRWPYFDGGEHPIEAVGGTIEGGTLTVSVPRGSSGTGFLHVAGEGYGALVWDADARSCQFEWEDEDMVVVGEVVDEGGTPVQDAKVDSCVGELTTDGHGVFSTHVPREACSFWVVIESDGLVGLGRPVWVVPVDTASVQIRLIAPDAGALRPMTDLEVEELAIKLELWEQLLELTVSMEMNDIADVARSEAEAPKTQLELSGHPESPEASNTEQQDAE